jgi:hypothetical protein
VAVGSILGSHIHTISRHWAQTLFAQEKRRREFVHPCYKLRLCEQCLLRRSGLLLQSLSGAADVSTHNKEITNYESYAVIPCCVFKESHI